MDGHMAESGERRSSMLYPPHECMCKVRVCEYCAKCVVGSPLQFRSKWPPCVCINRSVVTVTRGKQRAPSSAIRARHGGRFFLPVPPVVWGNNTQLIMVGKLIWISTKYNMSSIGPVPPRWPRDTNKSTLKFIKNKQSDTYTPPAPFNTQSNTLFRDNLCKIAKSSLAQQLISPLFHY